MVDGGAGNDTLTGGQGKDVLRGGAGKDVVNARDHARGDAVNCGPGRDTALVDRGDVTVACEVVRAA